MARETSKEGCLLKHTAAIHVSNNLTLVDRQIYNILLQNAFKNLLSHESHSISIETLLNELGHQSYKNRSFIKESITKLVDTSLRFNVLGKDKKKKWESAISLLSSVHFAPGIVCYSFPKELSLSFGKPNIYASLNLKYQEQLTSKFTIALWEYCTEQLDSARSNATQSNIVSLNQLKILLGATEKSYSTFKVLNKRVLAKSTTEISKLTDITVSCQLVKEPRKITGVIFQIARKKTETPIINLDNNTSLFTADSSMNALDVVYQELDAQEVIHEAVQLGIKEQHTTELLKKFKPEQILSVLKLTKDRTKKGHNIDNILGYIWKILETGTYQILSAEEARISMRQKEVADLEEKANPDNSTIVREFFDACKAYWGDGVYKSWILHLNYLGHDDLSVSFSVATQFIKSWIETHYFNHLLKIWKQQKPLTRKFLIQLAKSDTAKNLQSQKERVQI